MTKDNIKIAALRLFLLRGYKNISLVDVANELGITKGGIYHYFGSKEDLLRAAIDHLFDRFEAKHHELFHQDRTFREVLYGIMMERELERYMEQLLDIQQGDYRANHASLALEVMHNFPGFQERMDRSHLQFCQVIEQSLQQAQEKGEITKALQARTLATLILSILTGQNVLGKDLNTSDSRRLVMEGLWTLISA